MLKINREEKKKVTDCTIPQLLLVAKVVLLSSELH